MYLTVSEVSDVMRVTRKTVRRWIRGGQLPAKRIGKKYAIPAKAVVGDDATSAASCERNQNPSDPAVKAVDSDLASAGAVAADPCAFSTSAKDGSASAERRQDAATFEGTRDADGPRR